APGGTRRPAHRAEARGARRPAPGRVRLKRRLWTDRGPAPPLPPSPSDPSSSSDPLLRTAYVGISVVVEPRRQPGAAPSDLDHRQVGEQCAHRDTGEVPAPGVGGTAHRRAQCRVPPHPAQPLTSAIVLDVARLDCWYVLVVRC